MTLRQRNKRAAIQGIQVAAMDLFDRRGYHNVTVDDIAREAGVSPSTFYRYFGTKEGLFTVDTFAAVGADSFQEILDLDDLAATMQRLADSAASAGPWRGMRYVMEEPIVRAAVYASMDGIADRLGTILTGCGHTPIQARVLARTYVFGVYLGALEQWHHDGRIRPISDYAREALAVIRPSKGSSP